MGEEETRAPAAAGCAGRREVSVAAVKHLAGGCMRGKTARNRKGRFVLTPDSPANYRKVYVDVFSVAASLSRPEELFASAAEAGINAVFVLDAWHEAHMPLARRYLELCRRYMLDCRLSEQKPAEIYAVELCEAECGAGCAVATRDYDAVLRAEKCAVLIFRQGKFWRAARG